MSDIFDLPQRVQPFTDKEIELATRFVDQAVIAIEKCALFEQLRERQAELRVTFDNMGAVASRSTPKCGLPLELQFPGDARSAGCFLAGRPSSSDISAISLTAASTRLISRRN